MLSDLYALKAIELIGKSLAAAVADGGNLEARADVALANTLAGMVESTSGCTSEHSLAHAISAYHPQFEHGAALISVSRAYYTHWAKAGCCDERMVDMAKGPRQEGREGARWTLSPRSRSSMRACGVDDIRMSGYGMKREELEKYARNARETMGGLYEVDPAPLSDADALKILEESYR